MCGVKVDMPPSKYVTVSFVLFSCSVWLYAFSLPCEKLLRVFVSSSCHFHGDRPWLTALKEVSSLQGPGKAKVEFVYICKIVSTYMFVGACARFFCPLPDPECFPSFSSFVIFLVEGLLWCLSWWHRQINQGRLNLSQAIKAEPSKI